MGTVVERKTSYLILSKMRGCTADAALDGFTRQMKRLDVCATLHPTLRDTGPDHRSACYLYEEKSA